MVVCCCAPARSADPRARHSPGPRGEVNGHGSGDPRARDLGERHCGIDNGGLAPPADDAMDDRRDTTSSRSWLYVDEHHGHTPPRARA